MAKRKTKKQKIKAASRVHVQTPTGEKYSLTDDVVMHETKSEVSKSADTKPDTRVSLSYKWVKHDILYSFGVSGGIFVFFIVLYFLV